MDYKQRLLVEYRELVERRSKLLDFLAECEVNKSPIDEQKLKLLQKQFEYMNGYYEILHERILLEMGGSN